MQRKSYEKHTPKVPFPKPSASSRLHLLPLSVHLHATDALNDLNENGGPARGEKRTNVNPD
jgi:hypothetical protein